ncbi:MAG: hypothetical protein IJS45_02805 [Clostridia bacterium]|nr:hypothetical protein [Clostridia bacterium]
MKRFLGAATGICSIAAAIVIYITVTKAAGGDADILPYVLSSVLAVCLSASLLCLLSVTRRVENLESIVKDLAESPYGEEYEGDGGTVEPDEPRIVPEDSGEYFATEDPDYKGTDFSEEYPVSANADDEEKI